MILMALSAVLARYRRMTDVRSEGQKNGKTSWDNIVHSAVHDKLQFDKDN